MTDQFYSLPLPRGVLAWLVPAPIWLYCFHLGDLFGSHALLLTHTGRKTGKIRHSIIEVMQYDKASGVFYVASGWGEKANWYQTSWLSPR